MEKLTFQEEEIMLIIWRLKEGVVKDFLLQMQEPHPPYTTAASVVKNLEKKGYIAGKRYGNTYVYRPLIDENDYKAKFMSWDSSGIILLILIKIWLLFLLRSRRFLLPN